VKFIVVRVDDLVNSGPPAYAGFSHRGGVGHAAKETNDISFSRLRNAGRHGASLALGAVSTGRFAFVLSAKRRVRHRLRRLAKFMHPRVRRGQRPCARHTPGLAPTRRQPYAPT
jgi:hypothetical protein